MTEHFTHGWIEVISGCMFSGKSEELIRRLRRAHIAKQRVMVFKPEIDDRGGTDKVTSHSKVEFPCCPIPPSTPEMILGTWMPNLSESNQGLPWSWDADVIGFDEVQFFDIGILEVIHTLAAQGRRVIVAGLDLDYRAIPFGTMPHLLALAQKVDKLTAICTECGAPATRTQRLTDSQDQIEIGASEKYAARCLNHFSVPH